MEVELETCVCIVRALSHRDMILGVGSTELSVSTDLIVKLSLVLGCRRRDIFWEYSIMR